MPVMQKPAALRMRVLGFLFRLLAGYFRNLERNFLMKLSLVMPCA